MNTDYFNYLLTIAQYRSISQASRCLASAAFLSEQSGAEHRTGAGHDHLYPQSPRCADYPGR